MKNILLLTCVLLFITGCNVETGSSEKSSDPVNAMNESGEPSGPHTSAEWQIWAYSTAGPAYIAEGATVYDGRKDAHEAMPLCGDQEVFKWITAYFAGTIPEMDKDGYAWMLHGDMGEDNSTPMVLNEEDSKPGHWIESGPHLMRMPKDPSTLEGMTTDFNSGAPYVMFSGTPYAHVMYPVQDYYKHQAQE